MCHDQTERIWDKYLRESLPVSLVPLVPLEASRSLVSSVSTFEDSLGRIPALAWAHAPPSAVLATRIADVGNDLKLAGFDESDNGRVFIRPCADLALLARPQEKPLPAGKAHTQWFFRDILNYRQYSISLISVYIRNLE